MIAKIKDIEINFDDSIPMDEVMNLIKIIPMVDEIPITEIDLESDGADRTMYIFIETDDEIHLHPLTEKFCESIRNLGFDVSISDEDYGCFDVVIVYFEQ